jgi:Hpt domain-containing protein
MKTPLVDLSFVISMSDNDTTYIYEVINLFLENVPDAVVKLDNLVHKTSDFEAIQKQAHLLKSSANVIKVRGMYDDLVAIEALARQATGKEKIVTLLENVLANFNEALPVLLTEKEKYRPGNKVKARK